MSFFKRIFDKKPNVKNSQSENSENSDNAMFKNINLLAQTKVKISSMEFSEEKSKKKLDISQFIQYFLTAPTWADCRRIIDKHPELLTEETERLMEDVSAWAPKNTRTMMDERLALFHQCCEKGLEAAFREMEPESDLELRKHDITPPNSYNEVRGQVDDVIVQYLSAPTLDDACNILFQHPELLSIKYIAALEDIATKWTSENRKAFVHELIVMVRRSRQIALGQQFLTTSDINKCRTILEENREILDEYVQEILKSRVQSVPENLRILVEKRWNLLQRCVEMGLEEAFGEKE